MGRQKTVTTPDSGVTANSYSGRYTTVTDASGKARVIGTDGLGRINAVWEDPSGSNFATYYGYDPLGDLTQVSQSGQTRTFSYDSLGRLLSATNPESGTVS